METFPLIRTKWSNERLMSAILPVLLLYGLPRFLTEPVGFWYCLALTAFALFLDTAIGFIRSRRPVCAVSSAVTALVLFLLTPGVPFWMETIAVAAALLLGKHIWGGTGKNPINPAMVGVVLISLFFTLEFPVFEPSWLLLPAMLLSLPFLLFRPFAGLGMALGMAGALLLRRDFDISSLIGSGVVLWSALIITDPVTTTARPLEGAAIGFLAGSVPLALSGSAGAFSLPGPIGALALGVLCSNLLSRFADQRDSGIRLAFHLPIRRSRIMPISGQSLFYDLTEAHPLPDAPLPDLSPEEILDRIERSEVFGFGGAAFPTGQKIRAALRSGAAQKHLIVNGVECDPGLIHDKWLLRNKFDEIHTGIGLLCRCVPFDTITIAVKDPAGILCDDPACRLHRVPDYYPAGAEKELIREVLGKKPASDEIPSESGILVLNVQTVLAVYHAVYPGMKADTRFLTFADLDKKTGHVLRVELGSDVRRIAETVHPGSFYVYTGGGMMDAGICPDGAVVDKRMNFLAVGRTRGFRESACSRCGLCAAVCPEGLDVCRITRFVDEGRMKQTLRLHPEKCLECGGCSYVCLAGRNLANRMKKAKHYN